MPAKRKQAAANATPVNDPLDNEPIAGHERKEFALDNPRWSGISSESSKSC
jgi:hypothetical protein